jgi:hypothetical protein
MEKPARLKPDMVKPAAFCYEKFFGCILVVSLCCMDKSDMAQPAGF